MAGQQRKVSSCGFDNKTNGICRGPYKLGTPPKERKDCVTIGTGLGEVVSIPQKSAENSLPVPTGLLWPLHRIPVPSTKTTNKNHATRHSPKHLQHEQEQQQKQFFHLVAMAPVGVLCAAAPLQLRVFHGFSFVLLCPKERSGKLWFVPNKLLASWIS